MIHFLVVHWKDSFWIEPQLRQMALTTASPYRVHAYFTGIDPSPWSDRFATAEATDVADHATKLNRIAAIAAGMAEGPDDLLVFLDSDSLPIAPWEEKVRRGLASRPLVAVRRDENLGDPQPHPCFAVTTVGFWQRIGGDWSKGYSWENAEGETVTDVGGNLLGALRASGFDWEPLLRSNLVNLHPLWFAVYGGIVYHHGAGSRYPRSRLDQKMLEQEITQGPRLFYKVVRGAGLQPLLLRRRRRAQIAANQKLSDGIRAKILQDPGFASRFTG